VSSASGEPTALAIVRAAERLFADRGLDGVSLREISREAGARNTNATQYHFGDRNGLLRAVVERHSASIDAERHQLLDHCERGNGFTLDQLAHALVIPQASKLTDADGGREFLRIQGHLFARPDFRPDPDREPRSTSIQRWRRMAGPFLPAGAEKVHRRFSAITLMTVELARRAERPTSRDHSLFVSNLVDLVAGMLAAELSPATKRALKRRP